MGKKEDDFLARAPKWRKKDIEAVNALFDSYIFRREKTGEVWTTCCRKHVTLPPEHPIWNFEHMSQPRHTGAWGCHMGMMSAPAWPKEAECPFCGKKGKVKDVRYSGRRKNLWQERRCVILHWYRGALWALAVWAVKDYARDLTEAPRFQSGAAYRFGKTAVEYVPCHYWYGYGHYRRDEYRDFNKNTVDYPFSYTNEDGMGYWVIGTDELSKSAVRYCCLEEYWRNHKDAGDTVKMLHLAHARPRQVEMLMKAGLSDVVRDLAISGVKHARVLDWTQTDPRRAFKVTPSELREFLNLAPPEYRLIGVLEKYRTLKREDGRFTMSDAHQMYAAEKNLSFTVREKAKEWGLTTYRFWRYIMQTGLEPKKALCAWSDYTRAALSLGRPLHRENVLLPKDLGEAHDEAVRQQRERLEAEKKEKTRLEREARQKGYEAIKKKLKLKYEIEAGGYLILVPESEAEIVEEGKALQHCVGGYAQRHVEGRTVILFLRDARRPDKPYITIEMDGGQLRQIHGFKNEGAYSTGGRIAPDPRETFRWLIDPWLSWICRGSRRDRKGNPKGLIFKQEAKTA